MSTARRREVVVKPSLPKAHHLKLSSPRLLLKSGLISVRKKSERGINRPVRRSNCYGKLLAATGKLGEKLHAQGGEITSKKQRGTS